jgi:hypothetical protein
MRSLSTPTSISTQTSISTPTSTPTPTSTATSRALPAPVPERPARGFSALVALVPLVTFVTFVTCVTLGAGAAAQTLLLKLPGPSGDDMGYAVAGAGDVDGDGCADFLAGVPQASSSSSPATGYVLLCSGRTGIVLRRFDGDSHGDSFGHAVSGGSDVDGDKVPDILCGAPGDDDGGTDAGSVRAFSGKDGSVLYTVHGATAGDRFGKVVAFVGDATGDGVPDFVVGAPEAGGGAGAAWLHSGVDGGRLRTMLPGTGDKLFGASACGVSDLDGDGRADYVVGAPGGVTSIGPYGYVVVYSGGSGKVLFSVAGSYAGGLSGAVAAAGDVDLDTYPDVLVGAPGLSIGAIRTGGAFVFSGKDGALIHTLATGKKLDRYGFAVAGLGDIDGDGYPDAALGALDVTAPVTVFSGADGKVLFALSRPTGTGLPGSSLAAVGDVDGDGVDDLLTGDRGFHLNYSGGAVLVYSGTRLGLSTDAHQVRVKSKDHCVFALDAGAAHAGKPYLLVGSFTGTAPGIRLAPGVLLPLNYDDYTGYGISDPNTIIKRSSGSLDSAGKATADFGMFPAIPLAAIGLTIHHAFVVFDAGRTRFQYASNARPLTFVAR